MNKSILDTTLFKFKISHVSLYLLLFYFASFPLPAQSTKTNKLKKEIKGVQSDSLRVIKMIRLSRELQRGNNAEKRAYQNARKAVDLALKINKDIIYARALDNLGLLYRFNHLYAQAIPLHKKAFQLVVSRKDVQPIYKMIYANNLGVAARYSEKYDLSVKYYLKALAIAQKEDNLKNIAISSNGLGNALSNIPGKELEALRYFENAIHAERENKNSLGVAMNLLSISGYFIGNGKYEKALQYLDTLYQINRRREDIYGLAITNAAYGNAYFQEGNYLDKAENYYTKALQQFKELNKPGKVAQILRSLGGLYSKTHHLEKALSFYLQSTKMADSLQNKSLLYANLYSLSQIKEKKGDFKVALQYYKKAKMYEDSIALSNQTIKIAALTNQYKLDKKESKIVHLQKKNTLKAELVRVQKQKIKLHRLYFIALFIGILLLFLFIYLQYKSRKTKKEALHLLQKNKQQLLKAEYEKSIAQAEMLVAKTQLKPHFLFNCLNGIHLFLQRKETQKADQYLIDLSRFMRKILELPQSESIALSEEIELIQNYIQLEKNRFDEHFYFDLKALPTKDMEILEIPPLLLQPFVENAIWHGLLPSEKEKKVLQIDIREVNEDLEIIIEDNGVGRSDTRNTIIPSSSKNKSMGMKITRNRITQHNKTYKNTIHLEIIDKINERTNEKLGTKVILRIRDCL